MRATLPPFRAFLLVIFAAGLVLFLTIALRHVEPFTTTVYKGPLGADTLNGAEAFAELKYEWKHPLMSPVAAGATAVFGQVLGFDRASAIAGGIALLAAANILICALMLQRLLADPAAAALGAALCALLFTNLNVLAVTDSYAVSSLATWLFVLAWAGGYATASPPWARLGPLHGVAGLCNPPLLTLAGLPAGQVLLDGRPRRAALTGLATGAAALALMLVVVLTHSTLKWGTPWAYFDQSADYAGHYAELERATRLTDLADVVSCFLLFAVATPVDAVPSNGLRRAAAAGYLQSPRGLLALAGVTLVLGAAAASLLGRWWRTALPLVAWIAALAAFYALFKPTDAMLYGAQVQGALTVLACLGFASIARRPRTLRWLLLATILLLALRNLPVVLFAPYGFESRYVPHRALLAW